jgi:perosamine synthetase
MHSLVRELLTAVSAVTNSTAAPLHAPHFGGNELAYLKDCLDTTFVSSVGPFVDRFERDLVDFTGAKHAVVVVNGTAALHLALLVIGVRPGDEVLVPALTFVATANAVAHCKAVPHFVDSCLKTLGVDPIALRAYLEQTTELKNEVCINRITGRVIRAIVPVHVFGHPVDMNGLLAVASDFNLAVVEDAAESLGSRYRGRHTGTFGIVGTLSFNGNKIITTGGGGALLTNDELLARRAKHLTTTAKLPHRWEFCHDEVAFNYRMPNLNAALGCAQLEQLPAFLAEKRRLYKIYHAALDGIRGVHLLGEPAECVSNFWLQTLILDESFANLRDSILAATNDVGLMTRPTWVTMHRLPAFQDCPRMPLAAAESLERRVINLPSSAVLGKEKSSWITQFCC